MALDKNLDQLSDEALDALLERKRAIRERANALLATETAELEALTTRLAIA